MEPGREGLTSSGPERVLGGDTGGSARLGRERRSSISVWRRFLGKFKHERPSFRIEPLDSPTGFRIIGDLDVYSVDRARQALEPELHGTLVLDLSGVEFMDDSGLGCLVWVFKRLREQGGSLIVRNPSRHVGRVLEVTGLSKLPGLTIEVEGESP